MIHHFIPRQPRGLGGLFFEPYEHSSYGSNIYGGMLGGNTTTKTKTTRKVRVFSSLDKDGNPVMGGPQLEPDDDDEGDEIIEEEDVDVDVKPEVEEESKTTKTEMESKTVNPRYPEIFKGILKDFAMAMQDDDNMPEDKQRIKFFDQIFETTPMQKIFFFTKKNDKKLYATINYKLYDVFGEIINYLNTFIKSVFRDLKGVCAGSKTEIIINKNNCGQIDIYITNIIFLVKIVDFLMYAYEEITNNLLIVCKKCLSESTSDEEREGFQRYIKSLESLLKFKKALREIIVRDVDVIVEEASKANIYSKTIQKIITEKIDNLTDDTILTKIKKYSKLDDTVLEALKTMPRFNKYFNEIKNFDLSIDFDFMLKYEKNAKLLMEQLNEEKNKSRTVPTATEIQNRMEHAEARAKAEAQAKAKKEAEAKAIELAIKKREEEGKRKVAEALAEKEAREQARREAQLLFETNEQLIKEFESRIKSITVDEVKTDSFKKDPKTKIFSVISIKEIINNKVKDEHANKRPVLKGFLFEDFLIDKTIIKQDKSILVSLTENNNADKKIAQGFIYDFFTPSFMIEIKYYDNSDEFIIPLKKLEGSKFKPYFKVIGDEIKLTDVKMNVGPDTGKIINQGSRKLIFIEFLSNGIFYYNLSEDKDMKKYIKPDGSLDFPPDTPNLKNIANFGMVYVVPNTKINQCYIKKT